MNQPLQHSPRAWPSPPTGFVVVDARMASLCAQRAGRCTAALGLQFRTLVRDINLSVSRNTYAAFTAGITGQGDFRPVRRKRRVGRRRAWGAGDGLHCAVTSPGLGWRPTLSREMVIAGHAFVRICDRLKVGRGLARRKGNCSISRQPHAGCRMGVFRCRWLQRRRALSSFRAELRDWL
jgi:hypothetical protein